MTLLELYRLDEMSAKRKDAMWAVLDWAAQQQGEFTMKDLFQIFQRNGGGGSITSLHTAIGKMTAENPYFTNRGIDAPLSDKHPFIMAKRGSRGAGSPNTLRWGLDHPLREPPDPNAENNGESPDDEAIGDATDRLEALVGRDKLKSCMARWKNMKSIHQAVTDIKGNIPMRGQMDALHIASSYLTQSGEADADDVEQGEEEIEAPTPPPVKHDAPGGASQKPQAPAQFSPQRPAAPTRQPEPEQDDEPTDPNIDADEFEDDDTETDVPPPAAKPSMVHPHAPYITKPQTAVPGIKKHSAWGKKR
jgi:hypothetical protein